MARSVPNHLSTRQKEFMKLLRSAEVHERHSLNEVFTMFLEMGYCAIKKTTCIGPAADACEEAYMRVVGRMHKPQKTANILAQCLSVVTLALEEELHDFLGPIFMETVSNPHLGQFFTPDSLSYMLGEMTSIPSMVEELDGVDYITASEPAAGTGGIVMAATRSLAERKLDFSRRVIWHIVELDHRAFMGCYIQLSLAGVNALVVHGNTITLDVFDQAITPIRMLHPRPFRKKPKVRTRSRPKNVVPK